MQMARRKRRECEERKREDRDGERGETGERKRKKLLLSIFFHPIKPHHKKSVCLA